MIGALRFRLCAALLSALALLALLASPTLRASAQPAPLQASTGDAPAEAPRRGASDARVTIVEYADFHCRYCAMSARTLRTLLKNYPTQVRLEFRHFSASLRPSDRLAHEASIAAQAQGKFWEMHDLLFSNVAGLTRERLFEYARELNLDMAAFTEALESRRYRQRVVQETDEARRAGVRAIPTFVINGTTVVGAQDLPRFRVIVDAQLARLAPTVAPAPSQ